MGIGKVCNEGKRELQREPWESQVEELREVSPQRQHTSQASKDV